MTLFVSAAILAASAICISIYGEYRITQKIKHFNPELLDSMDEDITDVECRTEVLTLALDAMRKEEVAQENAIKELKHDNEMLHRRLSLCNRRSEHIEHYLGLRSHSFTNGERMWDFHQITHDLKAREAQKPESIHFKERRLKRENIKGAA